MNEHASNQLRARIQTFKSFLDGLGKSSITGWRWRRDGRVKTVNILGRVYITDEAIREFLARAEAGEFAKEHSAPRRKESAP